MEAAKTEASLTQQRVAKVLERIAAACAANDDEAEAYADVLEEMLQALQCDDFFGTEAQSDPRGDFRNGGWSMYRVEGVDA